VWKIVYLDARGLTHEAEFEARDIHDAIDEAESEFGDDIDIICLELQEDEDDNEP